MSRSIQNEYAPDYVSPPGETLVETIEALGMSQAQLPSGPDVPKRRSIKSSRAKRKHFRDAHRASFPPTLYQGTVFGGSRDC